VRGRWAKSILLCAAAAAIAAPTALAIDTTVPLPTSTTVPLPTSTSVPLPTSTTVPLPTSTSVPLPTSSTNVVSTVVSTVSQATSSLAQATSSASSAVSTASSSVSKVTTTTAGSATSTSSGATSGTGASGSGAGAPTGSASGSSSSAATAASDRRFKAAEAAAAIVFAPVTHPVAKLHTTRTWVRSGSRRSAAKIVFRLRRGGVVHFVVTQVAPVCRRVGTFAVRAHRGVNKVTLRGRLHGRPLRVGTYVLSATVRGRPLVGVTVVVTGSRPTLRELARARARNACAAMLVERVFRSTLTFRQPTGMRGPLPLRTRPGPAPVKAAGVAPRNVLGAEFAKPASGSDFKRLFLFAACCLAIALLGLAVLPATAVANPRLGMLVERRRIELALAGAGTLLGALLSYLVTGG
jgi:hypothetical protein